MALSKSIQTQFGIPATYWMVDGMAVTPIEAHAEIRLAGYVDEASRRAGFAPLERATVTLTGKDFPGDRGSIQVNAIYATLKQQASWTDAKDC
jgi:hypothetical protein